MTTPPNTPPNPLVPPQTSSPATSSGSSAVMPLVLSAVGLITCCFPAGAIGAVMAIKQRNEAKKQGQTPSGLSLVSITMGAISVLSSLGFIGFGVYTYGQNQAEAKSLQDSVAEKRDGSVLLQDVACVLARAEFQKLGTDNVTCTKPLQTNGNRAVLSEVSVKSGETTKSHTVCFAKAKRWFIVETRTSGECSEREMDKNLSGLPTGDSPEDLEKAEELYREDEVAFQKALHLVAFNHTLEKVAKVVDKASESEKKPPSKCPDLSTYTSEKTAEIGYIERARLGDFDKKRSDAQKRWDFMTKRELRDLLSDGPTAPGFNAEKSLEALETLPLLAVFLPDGEYETAWPVPTGSGFDGGMYDGSMYLVDTARLEVLCAAPFKVENGDTIQVRRSKLGITAKSSIEAKLAADFEEHFEDAAVERIKDLSAGKLKLGIGLLE